MDVLGEDDAQPLRSIKFIIGLRKEAVVHLVDVLLMKMLHPLELALQRQLLRQPVRIFPDEQ